MFLYSLPYSTSVPRPRATEPPDRATGIPARIAELVEFISPVLENFAELESSFSEDFAIRRVHATVDRELTKSTSSFSQSKKANSVPRPRPTEPPERASGIPARIAELVEFISPVLENLAELESSFSEDFAIRRVHATVDRELTNSGSSFRQSKKASCESHRHFNW